MDEKTKYFYHEKIHILDNYTCVVNGKIFKGWQMKINSVNILGWTVKIVYKEIDPQYCGLFYADESLIEINKNLKNNTFKPSVYSNQFIVLKTYVCFLF